MSDWTAPIPLGEILKDELAEIGLNGAALAKTARRTGEPD